MEGRTVRTKLPAHQRDVALSAVYLALVRDHAELAVARLNAAFARAHNIALVPQPVADQFRHRKNQQPVLLAERNQVRNPRHLSVVAHDLADHPRRIQPRQPRQIHASLGLPGAHQHPAPARPQRKHVPRPRQIGIVGAGIDRGADGVRPVGRRDPRCNPLARLDGLGKRRPKPRRVLLRHGEQPQMIGAFLGQRQADQSPAIPGHEVDRLRGHKFCGQRQVAFVLPVLVVHHHHHAAGADLGERAGNVRKGGLESA